MHHQHYRTESACFAVSLTGVRLCSRSCAMRSQYHERFVPDRKNGLQISQQKSQTKRSERGAKSGLQSKLHKCKARSHGCQLKPSRKLPANGTMFFGDFGEHVAAGDLQFHATISAISTRPWLECAVGAGFMSTSYQGHLRRPPSHSAQGRDRTDRPGNANVVRLFPNAAEGFPFQRLGIWGQECF